MTFLSELGWDRVPYIRSFSKAGFRLSFQFCLWAFGLLLFFSVICYYGGCGDFGVILLFVILFQSEVHVVPMPKTISPKAAYGSTHGSCSLVYAETTLGIAITVFALPRFHFMAFPQTPSLPVFETYQEKQGIPDGPYGVRKNRRWVFCSEEG